LKLYEFIIKPRSPFGTPLKGDTLFGHFCWQAKHDPALLSGGLERWIDMYHNRPFAVFSSAWPKLSEGGGFYALKRPDIPLTWLFLPGSDRKTTMKERKEKAGRKWLLVPENLVISLNENNFINDTDLAKRAYGDLTDHTKRAMRGKDKRRLTVEYLQPHNTISRRTMTTGEGMFSPYSSTTLCYYPETKLAIFVLIDEEATDADSVCSALERIGNRGYGRDASTGLGRFDLEKAEEKALLGNPDADAFYALGPVVPERGVDNDYYFTPFTRFGKHGDILATSKNPFKCPVVMADEGAVFVPKSKKAFEKPYMGRAIRNISKSEPRARAQGYAPYLPFKLEKKP
jgi:CRISPR-associated protein Csm4